MTHIPHVLYQDLTMESSLLHYIYLQLLLCAFLLLISKIFYKEELKERECGSNGIVTFYTALVTSVIDYTA